MVAFLIERNRDKRRCVITQTWLYRLLKELEVRRMHGILVLSRRVPVMQPGHCS